MVDAQLRQLERAFKANPSISAGRQLCRYLLKAGRDEEAQKLSDSLEYVAQIKSLPRPTDAQCRAFVEYVACAHSWYKHLHHKTPCYFYVYLNPGVMMFENGEMVTRKDCIHYSSYPTEEYREKFNYWTYHTVGPEAEKPELRTPDYPLPEELYIYTPITANVYGAKFEKAIAPPKAYRKDFKLETLNSARYGFMVRYTRDDAEEFAEFNQRARDSLAQGKRELRALYRATQLFLETLDGLYAA